MIADLIAIADREINAPRHEKAVCNQHQLWALSDGRFASVKYVAHRMNGGQINDPVISPTADSLVSVFGELETAGFRQVKCGDRTANKLFLDYIDYYRHLVPTADNDRVSRRLKYFVDKTMCFWTDQEI